MSVHLREAIKYLKETKIYIYSIVWVFIICTLIGFFFASHLGRLDILIQELLDKTQGLGTLDLIVYILLNNIQSALFGLFLGFALAVFPILHGMLNGVVLGYVLRMVWNTSGFMEFWRLLPHGIFELPAIFISLGLGLRLSTFAFSPKPLTSLKVQLFYSLLIFLMIVVPLLIIAAIIEGSLIGLYG